jgi:endoglucanase
MIVGTPNWDQKPADVIGAEVDDANVAYSLHFYAGSDWHHFGTGGGGISQSAQAALDAGLPLFVTEWGATHPNNDPSSLNEGETRKWMDFLDENDISSCNWSITAVDEGSAAIKPWASASGGWSDGDISSAGHLIKGIIQEN